MEIEPLRLTGGSIFAQAAAIAPAWFGSFVQIVTIERATNFNAYVQIDG